MIVILLEHSVEILLIIYVHLLDKVLMVQPIVTMEHQLAVLVLKV